MTTKFQRRRANPGTPKVCKVIPPVILPPVPPLIPWAFTDGLRIHVHYDANEENPPWFVDMELPWADMQWIASPAEMYFAQVWADPGMTMGHATQIRLSDPPTSASIWCQIFEGGRDRNYVGTLDPIPEGKPFLVSPEMTGSAPYDDTAGRVTLDLADGTPPDPGPGPGDPPMP